jgi:hypothetical protein
MVNIIITGTTTSVIDIHFLEASGKITLTELESPELNQPSSSWFFNSRFKRNMSHVSLAGGLSAAGSYVSGFFPTTAGIICGGVLGGIGNSTSTWLAWEKKRELLIQARILHDFPILNTKLTIIQAKLSHLVEFIKFLDAEVDQPTEESTTIIEEPVTNEKNKLPCFWRTRNQRNFLRVFLAGALSAAGGWLGGFEPSVGGIIAGGALGGIGNAVSTWLAFEQINDGIIRKSALEILPELVKVTEKNEEKLIALIERIKILQPHFLVNFESQTISIPTLVNNIESSTCCLTRTRAQRNFIYVNTAGWLSGAGGWISGFFPNTPGILVGGATSAAANSISTWLAWEKPKDQKVERVVLQDFPQTLLKISELSKQVMRLTVCVEEWENQSRM